MSKVRYAIPSEMPIEYITPQQAVRIKQSKLFADLLKIDTGHATIPEGAIGILGNPYKWLVIKK